MRSTRTTFLVLGLLGVVSITAGMVVGQRGRDDRRRQDTSPIDLPNGARVEFLEMESDALNGRGQFSLFFPPSYREGRKHYPVVYFLHGIFNDHTSWTVNRYGNLPEQIEQLMLSQKLPEMLIVHPNGGRSFYTNYKDGSLNYEDFVVKELPAFIESNYRAKSGRDSRAIAGTSMGGYGSLKIALRYPNLYVAAAAHSAIIFPIRNPFDVPVEVRSSRPYQFFSEIFTAIYGDPFDQDYYDANNPLELAKNAPADLPLYFDYGTADRYKGLVHLDKGLKMLDRTLSERGVQHTFHEYPGEPHGWALVVAHMEESLSFVTRGF